VWLELPLLNRSPYLLIEDFVKDFFAADRRPKTGAAKAWVG
jgi:hypothetical protein